MSLTADEIVDEVWKPKSAASVDSLVSSVFDDPWYIRAANDVGRSDIGGALDYADASVGPMFEKLGGGLKTKLASSFIGELLPDETRMNLFRSGMEDVADARHRERAMSGNFSPDTVTERVLSSGLNSLAYQAPDLLTGAAAGALSGPLAPVVAPLVAGGLLYGKTAIPSEADARFERPDATGKISDYATEQGKAEVMGEIPSLVSTFAPIPGIVKIPLTAALDAAGEAWTQRMQDESNILHNINPPSEAQRSENELVAGLSGLLGGAIQGGVMSAAEAKPRPAVVTPEETVNIYAEQPEVNKAPAEDILARAKQTDITAPITAEQQLPQIEQINGKSQDQAAQIAQNQTYQAQVNEQGTLPQGQPLVRQVTEGQVGTIYPGSESLITDRSTQERIQEAGAGLPYSDGVGVRPASVRPENAALNPGLAVKVGLTRSPSLGSQTNEADGDTSPSSHDIAANTRLSRPSAGQWYYSQLASAVEQSPPKIDGSSATQWRAWLQSNANKLGVKADELQWSGVLDWLASQGTSKINKEQVVEYLRYGGVRVEETMLYGNGSKKSTEEKARAIFNDSKFEEYRPPDGENYREILLTLPRKKIDYKKPASGDIYDPSANTTALLFGELSDAGGMIEAPDDGNYLEEEKFRSPHWNQPNVLAHLRVDDVTGKDGRRYLRLIEIQSDWGQDGRRKGFDPAGEIHSAPFVTNTKAWLSLAIKRAIALAADEGYDGIALVSGQQNANLYNLSKHVDRIVYYPKTKEFFASKGREKLIELYIKKEDLPELVGNEISERLLNTAVEYFDENSPYHELRGTQLRIGGEGMRAFYDQIVPQVANSVLKNLGANTRLSPVEFTESENSKTTWGPSQLAFPITPELRAKAAEGLPLFKRDANDKSRRTESGAGASAPETFRSQGEALAHLEKRLGPGVRKLANDGVLVFTDGKAGWPQETASVVMDRDNALYWKGRAWIDLAATSKDRLPAVVLHEIGEHYGMERMLGAKDYATLHQRVVAMAKAGNNGAGAAWADVAEVYEHLTKRLIGDSAWNAAQSAPPSKRRAMLSRDTLRAATENPGKAKTFISEVLAKLGETQRSKPWWRQLVAKIKAWLVRHGFARDAVLKSITDDDIHSLMMAALRHSADRVTTTPRALGEEAMASRTISDAGEKSSDAAAIHLAKQEPSILDSPLDLGRKVGAALIFAPHNEIRSWNTEAGSELADLVYRATESENRSIKGPINDIINSRFKALGKYSTTLHDILGKYMRTRPLDPVSFIWSGERLPQITNDALVKFLETGVGPKKLEPTARALRKWIDDLHQYQRDAGIDLGYLENFFPHVYDTDKMEKRTVRAAFFKMLQVKHGISEQTATEIYRHIILGRGVPEMSMRGQEAESSRIQADKSGNLFSIERRALGREGKEVKAGHTRERVLKLPYEDLKPFLVTDLASVLGRYMNASVRRAEYARAFGPNESKLNDLVRGVLQELSDRGEQRISTGHVLDTVYGMADDLQGVYNPIENQLVEQARRAAHQFEILIKLALVSIASMPEFLTPGAMLAQGPKAQVIGLMKGLSHAVVDGLGAADQFITGSRHIPETTWTRAAEEVGIIYKGAIQDAISYEFGTPLSKTTAAFMKVTMLEFLTKVHKVAANEAFKAAARDWAKEVSKNPKKESHAKQMLEDFGISVDRAADWAKSGFPQNHPAFDAVLSGGARFAIMAVTTPTEATRSMLLKEPRLSLVFQYKSFANTFGNTFLRRMLVQMGRGKGIHKVAMLPYLAGMVAIAFAGQELKDWWYYGKNKPYAAKKEAWRRWLNAIDRAGFTGSFQPLFELASPYRYSYFDDLYVRLVGLMGPLFNDAARLGDAALKRDEKAGAKAITRMIPGTQVLDKETRKNLEKGIAKKLK